MLITFYIFYVRKSLKVYSGMNELLLFFVTCNCVNLGIHSIVKRNESSHLKFYLPGLPIIQKECHFDQICKDKYNCNAASIQLGSTYRCMHIFFRIFCYITLKSHNLNYTVFRCDSRKSSDHWDKLQITEVQSWVFSYSLSYFFLLVAFFRKSEKYSKIGNTARYK